MRKEKRHGLTLSLSKRSLREVTWCSRCLPTSLHRVQISCSSVAQYRLTVSLSCSRQARPRRCPSPAGSSNRWLVNGFLLGCVARRQRSQYDAWHVAHVFTASRGGSCSQNWQGTRSSADMALPPVGVALRGRGGGRRRLSLGEPGPLNEAFWKRSMMFCSVTLRLRPSRPRGLNVMTWRHVGHWKADTDSSGFAPEQWETKMRWAQLKHRLWAQGSSSGSSNSSKQIGHVSSDSRVSIFSGPDLKATSNPTEAGESPAWQIAKGLVASWHPFAPRQHGEGGGEAAKVTFHPKYPVRSYKVQKLHYKYDIWNPWSGMSLWHKAGWLILTNRCGDSSIQ